MNRKICAVALIVFGLAGNGAVAEEFHYDYSSVVTQCTGACASIASLDVGATITGQVVIDTAPGGSFGDADIGDFQLRVFNPAVPPSGFGDPANDNPLIISSSLGSAAPNGTAGTTDAENEINGGQMLFEFLEPPLNSNGAFLVFDLSTGNGKICIFFVQAGCVPGATEIATLEGRFVFLGGQLSYISVNTTDVDFGEVIIGGNAQIDVRFENVDDVPIVMGLVGDLVAPFSFGADTCSMTILPVATGVPGDNRCTVEVLFQPTSAGDFADSFDIPSSDFIRPVVQVSVAGSTPADAIDTDNDGVPDDQDNCTLVANVDQRDTNDDGFGNICDPDLDNNGIVNVIDLGLLKSVFFLTAPQLDEDFDGDRRVNVSDLGILKSYFFGPPGPSCNNNNCVPASLTPSP